MNLWDIYATLPAMEQHLHGLHFMICSFAVLVAVVPALATKGSAEHRIAGLIYVPLSLAALLLATYLALHEASFLLFSFNAFCAYLLLSGWRAVHEPRQPKAIDWMIPGALLGVAIVVAWHALLIDEGARSCYLLFFVANAVYLSWRDWHHLQHRTKEHRRRVFFAGIQYGPPAAVEWLNRHVAGMVGSVLANGSVVVLTVLPFALHWMWPATLIAVGLYISYRDREKKRRVMATLSPIISVRASGKKTAPSRGAEPWRRAA